MQLYIMRHGQANPIGHIDHLRELTSTGHLEAKAMGKWFNDFDIVLNHVFISPFIRAQQTAETLIRELNLPVRTKTINFITPSDDAKKVHDYIDGLCAGENIEHLLIVSHMPLVSYLVSELTADNNSPIFQTAAIAQIDYDVKTMTGRLVKLISPTDLL